MSEPVYDLHPASARWTHVALRVDDIDAMIRQAFAHFSQRARPDTEQLWRDIFAWALPGGREFRSFFEYSACLDGVGAGALGAGEVRPHAAGRRGRTLTHDDARRYPGSPGSG